MTLPPRAGRAEGLGGRRPLEGVAAEQAGDELHGLAMDGRVIQTPISTSQSCFPIQNIRRGVGVTPPAMAAVASSESSTALALPKAPLMPRAAVSPLLVT